VESENCPGDFSLADPTSIKEHLRALDLEMLQDDLDNMVRKLTAYIFGPRSSHQSALPGSCGSAGGDDDDDDRGGQSEVSLLSTLQCYAPSSTARCLILPLPVLERSDATGMEHCSAGSCSDRRILKTRLSCRKLSFADLSRSDSRDRIASSILRA
jgi:hypothetical protein